MKTISLYNEQYITANVHNKTHNTEKQSDWDSHWALTQGFTLVYNWNANESDFNLKAWQRYLLWLCISTHQLELLKWNKLQWNMNMIFHLQNTRYTDLRFIKYEIGNDASYTKLTNEQECTYHYIRNSLSVTSKKEHCTKSKLQTATK